MSGSRIIALCVVAAGLGLGFGAVLMTKNRIATLSGGVRVSGEVVRVEERPSETYKGQKSSAFFPEVRYRVAETNQDVLLMSDTATKKLRVGDQVDVVYQIESPNDGKIVDFWVMWAKTILLWVVSLMVTAMGAGVWFLSSSPSRE